MPAFVTHEIFGTQLFGMLDEPIVELLEYHPAPYFWGLQGPDLLFFRDAVLGRSMLPRYGNLMHALKVDELFTALSCYLNLHRDRKEYETLLAYIVGFVGHYCLDAEAHPYIYYLQMQKERVLDPESAKGIHHRIESDIDTAYYELKRGRNIRSYRPSPRLLGSDWEYEVIAQLYVTILWEVYGLRVTASEIKPNLFSPHIRRKRVLEDILNLEREQWFNLETPEKIDTRSFPQIAHIAAYRAADMVESLYHGSVHGVVYEPRGLKSFDNGSPGSL